MSRKNGILKGKQSSGGLIESFSDVFINQRHLRVFLIIAGLIVAVVASVFTWVYFITLEGENGGKVILMEAVIYGTLLVISLIFVFLIGYEDNTGAYLKIIGTAGVILSMIGFYVLKIQILDSPSRPQGEYFYYILQFLLYLILSAVLAVIPVLIIYFIRRLIIGIFSIILR